MRIVVWLKSWSSLRRVSSSERMALQLQRRLNRAIERLERNTKRFRSVKAVVTKLLEMIGDDLDECHALQNQYQEAVDALKAENRVMSDITIPAMLASHRKLLKMHDADVAVEVRRAVAAAPNNEVG